MVLKIIYCLKLNTFPNIFYLLTKRQWGIQFESWTNLERRQYHFKGHKNKPRSSFQSIKQKRKKYGTTATLPMAGRPPKFSCPTTTTSLVRQTTVMLTVTEQPKSAAATEKDAHGSKAFKPLYKTWPLWSLANKNWLKAFMNCWHFRVFFFTIYFYSFRVYSFIYFWAAHTNKTALSICMLDTCWLWLGQ